MSNHLNLKENNLVNKTNKTNINRLKSKEVNTQVTVVDSLLSRISHSQKGVVLEEWF